MPPRRGRGRRSRVDGLPAEIKAELDRLLRSGLSQVDILRRLREPLDAVGQAPLSQSALSRYAVRMEAVGASVRETRALADAWIARLGEEPAGEVGQLAIEVLRTMVLRRIVDAAAAPDDPDGGDEPIDAKEIGALSLAMSRLERALERSRAGEAKLRAAVAAEAEAEARAAGVADDTAARIRDILIGKAPA